MHISLSPFVFFEFQLLASSFQGQRQKGDFGNNPLIVKAFLFFSFLFKKNFTFTTFGGFTFR
jgi:hypothetical protein